MSNLMELLKQKKQALQSNRRAKTVKPEDGKSRWRILPSWRPESHAQADQFWHDFGQHWIKDQKGDLKAVYICTDKTFGKPCAICSTIHSAIKASHDDETIKLFKNSLAGGRVLVNALHVDGPNPTEPVILEIAPSVFEAIINIIQEWGAETLDLATGKDIVIEKSGKGLNTKYVVQIAAKSAPVDKSVMKSITNLDEYVAMESEEQANRALSGFKEVAGLLPSSVTAAPARPALSSMLVDDEAEADLRALEGEVTRVEAAPAVAPAKAAASVSDTAELDDLLASLG